MGRPDKAAMAKRDREKRKAAKREEKKARKAERKLNPDGTVADIVEDAPRIEDSDDAAAPGPEGAAGGEAPATGAPPAGSA